MKISYKLWLGFGLLILLFGGVGVYLNFHLGQLGKSTIAVFEQPLKVVDQSRSAWDLFRTSREHVAKELSRVQFTDSQSALNRLTQYSEEFHTHLKAAEKAGEKMDISVDFDELHQLAERWYSLNFLRVGPANQTRLPDERGLTDLENKLAEELEVLIAESFKAVDNYRVKTEGMVTEIQFVSNILLIAALILGVVVAIYLSLSLTKPLAQLTESVKALATGDGDLTQRIHFKRRDEIGELAQQMDQFIDMIHQLVSATQNALQAASNGVVDVGVLADQSRVGAADQKQKLQDTAELVSLNRDGVANVSQNTHDAQKKVEEISQQTDQGRALVLNTTDSITKLAQEVKTAGQTVKQLADESSNITSLLKVIEEIADQTNLLALNAAIEAARAGDAGRGFAVVAEEVRALSKKTRDSTQDIQKTIQSIQDRVQSTHQVMIQGGDLAAVCVTQGESVSHALQEITQSVQTIVSMTDSIADEMDQQNGAMGKIDDHMLGVSQLADENAQSADSLQVQAQQMDLALQKVNSRLAKFKI